MSGDDAGGEDGSCAGSRPRHLMLMTRPRALLLPLTVLLLTASGLAACNTPTPPAVLASLNCGSIGDPKNTGSTYSECVQLWLRTNARASAPPG